MRSSCSRNYESCERRRRNKLGRFVDEESEPTETEETTQLYDLLRRDEMKEDTCLEKPKVPCIA